MYCDKESQSSREQPITREKCDKAHLQRQYTKENVHPSKWQACTCKHIHAGY